MGLQLSSRSAAVLGRPISHSLSPVLHRAAYAALGLTDWRYEAIDCGEADLAPLLARAPADVVGYSATMPLKRELVRCANEISSAVAAIGAGNTLLRTESGWRAENTDWIGIRQALDEIGWNGPAAAGGPAVVVGAGGTAQATLAALAALSFADSGVIALVRDVNRAVELRAVADRLGLDLAIQALPGTAELTAAGLVIVTLPTGAADPLADPVDGPRWRPEQTVLDVVYADWPTALARSVTAAGAQVISGARLLLYQAAAQVELMTGRPGPVPAMRAALLAAVPGCGA